MPARKSVLVAVSQPRGAQQPLGNPLTMKDLDLLGAGNKTIGSEASSGWVLGFQCVCTWLPGRALRERFVWGANGLILPDVAKSS